MNTQEVGMRVKSRRKELRMNQKALADALGVSQPEVSNIEKGKRALSSERVQQLSTVLKCDSSWLVSGTTGTVAASG